MASSQRYKKQIAEAIGGKWKGDQLSVTFEYDTVEEAKALQASIYQSQKALRLIKKELDQDIELIRQSYEEKIANAKPGCLSFLIGGDAAKKRKLSKRRKMELEPYEVMNLVIDKLLMGLNGQRQKLRIYIEEKGETTTPSGILDNNTTEKRRAMPRKARPLVEFNARIYTYPNSIAWGLVTNPIQMALSHKRGERRGWPPAITRSRSDYHKVIGEPFTDPSDEQIFCSLLAEHGIFVERFFHKSIRERVICQFAESEIDLQDFQRLLSSAWGYEYRIYRESDAIYRILDSIFDQTALHAFSKPPVYRQLETWFEKYQHPQNCILCGNNFRLIDLPAWIYFGSNGFKLCCFQCPVVGSPRKKELFSLIPSFVDACGFIPNASASPINHAFTSRLPTSQVPRVFRTYANMGGIDHAKKKFGSWFKALAQTGALPDGTFTTARGIRCLAQDGHVCHSLDEQRIDDWLSAHGLAHEREPYYPVHPIFNPTGRRRADWKVLDTFMNISDWLVIQTMTRRWKKKSS